MTGVSGHGTTLGYVAAKNARSAKKSNLIPWQKAKPAPVILISGPEAVLVRKAQDRLVGAVRKQGDFETTRLDAARCERGDLLQACAPSLFSADKLVIVDNLAGMSDAFLTDALAYLDDVNEDAVLILKHSGGNRGAKLTKTLERAGYPAVDALAVKTEKDKHDFAAREFTRAGRKIDPQALEALLVATGSDLSELDAGIDQLVADTDGVITTELVDKYYGGRVEATGFKVADATVAGHTAEALTLVRHALATGTDAVPIVAAVALKLRQLAKVQGLSGSVGENAAELKMAPWQIDRAKRDLRSWNQVALGEAILHAAAADEAVKGGGRDPVYAVERLVFRVSQLARTRR